MFHKPFNSAEIGYFRVGKIDLAPFVCTSEDIQSKCDPKPEAVKPGTFDDPDEKFAEPLPKSVLDLLRKARTLQYTGNKSVSEIEEEILTAYKVHFIGTQNPTWSVISLLRPGSDF
jgi:hypothetical protein